MKRLNRRNAIRKRCLDCSGGSYKKVADCEFQDCNFFPYRSGKGKQNAKARATGIRKYCLWCVADQVGEVWKCHSHDCALWPYRKTKTEKTVKFESLLKTGHIEAFPEAN